MSRSSPPFAEDYRRGAVVSAAGLLRDGSRDLGRVWARRSTVSGRRQNRERETGCEANRRRDEACEQQQHGPRRGSEPTSAAAHQPALPCLALPCLALPCLALPCSASCTATRSTSLASPGGARDEETRTFSTTGSESVWPMVMYGVEKRDSAATRRPVGWRGGCLGNWAEGQAANDSSRNFLGGRASF